MRSSRTLSIFAGGFVAGLVAVAFNFLLRLAGLAVFPPEAALNAFLSVIPASIEEPMVQQLGDFAGQLGLIIASLIAAAVYGLLALVFDRLLAARLLSRSLSVFESLLVFAFVPWLLFGVVLFPLVGASLFGVSSPSVSTSNVWVLPFSLLLVQGVFALVFAPRYSSKAALLVPNRSMTQGPRGGPSRREFIEKGAIAALALVGGIFGLASLGSLTSSQIQPSGGGMPLDLQDAPAIFRDPRLKSLVDSEATPNGSFYRVAIDVIDPSVNASTWALKVAGFVNSPKTYALQSLQALPQASQYTTLECVSNNINGNLVSNAKWTGVRISDLLHDAGDAQAQASYVAFTSIDGYSVGVPLSRAMKQDSLLAYSMNDQPLPIGHGYPLRAVIPGLYGMMSAKWVTGVQVVGATYEGYWQTRGWTNDATINTVAFIVEPHDAGQISLSQNNGSVIVAGYAFAGDRGVSKVEVSFDGGKTWQQAELKKPISNLTWALWAYEWRPSSTGEKAILARATDGGGQLQSSTPTGTFPSGATGYAFINTYIGS
jgi:DMSO/TMAO reductase YedYZ molybdopterin-dependent catalytic subunit